MTWAWRVFLAGSVVLLLGVPARAAPAADHAGQSVTVTIVGPSGTSGATGASEPTPSPTVDCLQTRDASNRPHDSFAEQAPMRVLLAAGCAEPHEVDIEVDIESAPVVFTHVDADGTGGFLTDAIDLPAPVRSGPHEVVVKTIDKTYRAPITVTAGANAGGGNNRGTQVLGNVITRHLPHTGAEIVRIVLYALALLVAGAGMIIVTRRRRRATT